MRLKNRLTPMRLTVQSSKENLIQDPEIIQKMKDYSETLIQQIDTMNAVASAFQILPRCQPNKMKR
jgi:nitrogen fixation/metabolism regulation signal transduction histidine kinase